MSQNHKKKKSPGKPASNKFEALVRVSGRGIGFAEEPSGKTVRIPLEKLNSALNRDFALIEFKPSHEKELSGRVLEIIKRKKDCFAGIIKEENGQCYLEPDDFRVYLPIKVSGDKEEISKLTDRKVATTVTNWGDHQNPITVSIKKDLGPPGENETEIQSIAFESGFSEDFPDDVMNEAINLEKAHSEELKKELENIKNKKSNRLDLRDLPCLTIDPDDAKDFDDALSYRELEKGVFEVGIHIADVSHYVKPGTVLDEEAENRATSVYMVDRTINMLPAPLSSNICSLVPNEDRFAFSALFKLNKNGDVLDSKFTKSIINSKKRFTYEKAQEVLTNGSGEFHAELSSLLEIAKVLRKQRIDNGSIVFESEEVKFILNEEKKPIGVKLKERHDTNWLVEEYMLLANKYVAKFVSKIIEKQGGVFIYRIHDLPDKERIADLAKFVKLCGHKLNHQKGKISSKEINRLLYEVEGTPEEHIVNQAAIRSMSKAIYSTKNVGHFGLAFLDYTHFTSPIRRYPDTLVHRMLCDYIDGKTIPKDKQSTYERLSTHSSSQEQSATEAERNSIKFKQAEYMEDKVGMIFEGIVSGLTERGIFAEEVTTKSEGFIKIKDVPGDYYNYDEKNYRLIGRKTKKTFRVGDQIKIKVLGADPSRRMIDYAIVE